MQTPPETRPAMAKQPLPRGIMLISMFLYLGTAVLVATAGLPDVALANVPRSLLFVGALALAVLATGLLLRWRWAWFGGLAFVVVQGYYLLLNMAQQGRTALIGLLLLLLMAVYLLLPAVRQVYLRRPQRG